MRSETAGEGLSQAVGVTAFWPVPSITVLGWWTKSAGTLCTLMSAPDKDSVCFYYLHRWGVGFPGGVSDKERACDAGSVPGLGRSPGGRHGNPLQYSCLENSMDRGPGRATVHGVAKSWTRLSEQFIFSSVQSEIHHLPSKIGFSSWFPRLTHSTKIYSVLLIESKL